MADLPDKIRKAVGESSLLFLNVISDSGFFEDAFSVEMIKSLFTFHVQPQVKLIIKIGFLQAMHMELDQDHYLSMPNNPNPPT